MVGEKELKAPPSAVHALLNAVIALVRLKRLHTINDCMMYTDLLFM